MISQDSFEKLGERMQAHFDRQGKPMGFGDYLRRFLKQPEPQCRGAAHYIRDTFDHFGLDRIQTPAGEVKRFKMFDAEFDPRGGRVAGQEHAQMAIYRLLNNFVREGRVNRLILLHGPNGSAKTSLIRAIVSGMEHYSQTAAGALYMFRWLFPTEKVVRAGAIGFGGQTDDGTGDLDTYAGLPGDALDAVLECEMKDHPLLLIPREQRRQLFQELRGQGSLADDFPLPDYLLHGELCAKCQAVRDALLAAYGGDSEAVLRHVQVLRLHYSGRYRKGVATVEPQMHVDAGEQQVTASRGLAALPRAIAHLDLFQARGPLVDANRGMLEYNDLLKRHIDTFKYLLVTCESSQVTLDRSNLFLDAVFIGSTNEMMLDSFKEYADFSSFKGRLELVRVPYLRRISEERLIYEDQVPEAALGRHLSAHTIELAAVWAVLTRLKKPQAAADASDELRRAIEALSPLDKALLFDQGTTPARLKSATSRELRAAVVDLVKQSGTDYEGRTGASAREVRMVLMNAVQREDRPCVSPLGLFEEIRELIADKTVFAFLQRRPEGDFFDQEKILAQVYEHYLDLLEDDASAAMGLVSESSYQELFNRYMQHVNHWLRGESLTDPISGKSTPPSEKLMSEVESIIAADEDDQRKFRQGLITRVGAYALEADRGGSKVESPPDYSRVFPNLFDRMRDDFVVQRRVGIRRNLENLLALLDEQSMEPKAREAALKMRESLCSSLGYCDHCVNEAMATLLKKRFED